MGFSGLCGIRIILCFLRFFFGKVLGLGLAWSLNDCVVIE